MKSTDIMTNRRYMENTEETRSSGNYQVFHKGQKVEKTKWRLILVVLEWRISISYNK